MVVGGAFYANMVAKLDALPALQLALATFFVLAAIDLKGFFSWNRNWSTGFLYLELSLITVFLIAEKYIVEEKIKKRAEAKILEQQKQMLASWWVSAVS